MTDNTTTQRRPELCIGCGKPMTKGTGFCRECAERGLGPCEACEGLSLLDVEESGND
jgi:predicted amidophosphoribosyltransferase